MNPDRPQLDAKTKKALYEVIPSGAQTKQQAKSPPADPLDRIDPQVGWGLFALACALLVVGLWMRRKEKNRPPEDGFAGLC